MLKMQLWLLTNEERKAASSKSSSGSISRVHAKTALGKRIEFKPTDLWKPKLRYE
jgi:hypothetical protein